jgi:hypothetical protein
LSDSLTNLCTHFVSSSVPPPLAADSPELDIDSRYLLPRLRSSLLYDPSALSSHVSDSWTFSAAQVEDQCTHQHTQSAPGCDSILPILLKHSGSAAFKALSTVFSYSWRHAVLPQQWTEANVMALYKGKGARSEPSSFRPISMTSIIIRTFEHLIHRPLAALLESRSFFHPLQFGFRKNHSTLDAINYLQSNTRAMYPTSHQSPCPTLFLDLQKAFDRVWHPKLMECVERAGITGCAWRWIAAFLSRRRIRTVDGNEHSSWHDLVYGVPQGAVLSPLLFNIFINTIARRISTACPRLQLQLYADDIAMQPKAPPLINGVRQHPGGTGQMVKSLFRSVLVHAFRLLNAWCAETRMRFGKDKTQWVVFDKRKGELADMDYSQYANYRLCGFCPEVVEEYNYLGVTHHRHLRWDTQAQKAVHRIRQDSFLLTRLIRPPAGPHFPAVRQMCLGYLRPRCTYAWAFWRASPRQVRQMQAAFIRPLQRSLGLPSSSHHLGLLAEAHCPSFEALHTQASARFLLRAQSLMQTDPQHPTSKALRLDRAAAAHEHCRAHVKSRVPVTTYASQTAIPHLINNVLARLPELAPLNSLMSRYFPEQPPGPAAAAPALPSNLTMEEIHLLTMVDTHREWRAEPTLSRVQRSTAPLLTIKTSPSLSLFLTHEINPMVSLRARMRANRIPTQYRRYHQRPPDAADPSCTHAACMLVAPHFLDTLDHILLACPRHQLNRLQLSHSLVTQHQYTTALTVAFLSGEVTTNPAPRGAELIQAHGLLDLTAQFLTRLAQERQAADPQLKFFYAPLDAD